MAKKGNAGKLAGLAALGALGYMALKGRGEAAPVENRDFASAGSSDLGDFNQANYGDQGVNLPAKAAASTSSGGPDERYLGDSSVSLPKGKPTDARYLASRDKQRKVEQDITDKAETDAENARLLARYPMKMAKNLPPDVDPRSAFRGARAPQNQADNAAARYFRGKIDRGEPLNETEKAQARRAGITGFKKGGAVKKMASGGMTSSSASKRADGIAQRGKTKGKMC